MFTSFEFIGAVLFLFLLYYIIPKKIQWILLLAANVLFYFYYSRGILGPLFILATALTIYAVGRILERYDGKLQTYEQEIKQGIVPKPSREEKRAYKKKINSKKKCWLVLCLFINLGILCVLKYTGWIMPIGISFYTFQAVGYLLDVYWKKCKPQKNVFRFVLFVSYFPQLIQGPISRYDKLSATLYKQHSFNWKEFCFGLERVLWGYFKKLVIADRISVAVEMLSGDPDYYTGAFVLVLMLFYAIQLYADFSGGIDIVIGISQALGIRVEENFIRPFFSKNIAEFWRRWHITMGAWFRDYVFYPCSISRPLKTVTSFCKKRFGMAVARRAAVYISSIAAWFATGVWHGMSWRFVVWGLVNCLVILISEELVPLYKKFHGRFPELDQRTGYRAFQALRTFMLMCCIRLFDNYSSVRLTVRQFIHMFTEFDVSAITQREFTDLGLTALDYGIVGGGVLVMFLVSLSGRSGSVREKISKKPYVFRYAICLILLFAVLLLGNYGVGYDTKNFIYNQF